MSGSRRVTDELSMEVCWFPEEVSMMCSERMQCDVIVCLKSACGLETVTGDVQCVAVGVKMGHATARVIDMPKERIERYLSDRICGVMLTAGAKVQPGSMCRTWRMNRSARRLQ